MTYDEFIDIATKFVEFMVWSFAVIGVLASIAFIGYITYTPEPTTRRVADRCINSACEPDQKCPAKFKRHLGECNGTR